MKWKLNKERTEPLLLLLLLFRIKWAILNRRIARSNYYFLSLPTSMYFAFASVVSLWYHWHYQEGGVDRCEHFALEMGYRIKFVPIQPPPSFPRDVCRCCFASEMGNVEYEIYLKSAHAIFFLHYWLCVQEK